MTKLSLLLKVLEGETLQSIQRELAHRALPDLGKNIKCGNSIISPDFSADLHALLESPAELARVNPFDWKAEFPAILAQPGGGFHVIM